MSGKEKVWCQLSWNKLWKLKMEMKLGLKTEMKKEAIMKRSSWKRKNYKSKQEWKCKPLLSCWWYVALCLTSCSSLLNRHLQMLHLKCCLPLWRIMWLFKFSTFLNFFLHIGHAIGSFAVTCLSFSSFTVWFRNSILCPLFSCVVIPLFSGSEEKIHKPEKQFNCSRKTLISA